MAYEPPDFKPNDLQLQGYLNLGNFLPGLSNAQQQLEDLQNNFVTPFLEEKQRARDALFKRIDGLQQGLTDINTAVDGVQNVIDTTSDLVSNVGNLAGEFSNLLNTPGIYFYTYAGESRNFTAAVKEDFQNGILTPDENGDLQPTAYGKNEVMAAVMLVLASDGGADITADINRILNVGTLFGQNFTDISNAYQSAVNAVDTAFNTYNVTYFSNGATGGQRPVDATNYEENAEVIVLSKNTLIKSGSTFTGWNTASDGSGTSYNPKDDFLITSDVSLYAQWS